MNVEVEKLRHPKDSLTEAVRQRGVLLIVNQLQGGSTSTSNAVTAPLPDYWRSNALQATPAELIQRAADDEAARARLGA
jgi:hypothetical protein